MIFILYAYCVYCYQTADPQMTVESWSERQKEPGRPPMTSCSAGLWGCSQPPGQLSEGTRTTFWGAMFLLMQTEGSQRHQGSVFRWLFQFIAHQTRKQLDEKHNNTKPEGVLAAENRKARQELIVSGLVQAHDSLKAPWHLMASLDEVTW